MNVPYVFVLLVLTIIFHYFLCNFYIDFLLPIPRLSLCEYQNPVYPVSFDLLITEIAQAVD